MGFIAEKYQEINDKAGAGIALAFLFGVLSLQFFLGGYMIQSVFQYWIGLVRDNPVTIPFFACGLAACFTHLSKAYLTLFIITWLVKLAS